MTRLLIGILAITGAVGCLPNIKPIRLDQNTVSSLKVKDLAVTKRVRPPFGAVTRGRAAIGVVPFVGLFTSPLLHAASTGESIIRSANLADPAIEIADGIAAALEKKYGIRRAGIIDIVDPPLEDDYLVLASAGELRTQRSSQMNIAFSIGLVCDWCFPKHASFWLKANVEGQRARVDSIHVRSYWRMERPNLRRRSK
jgi:hypothetical protein